MKHDTTFQDGIRATLNVMHRMLTVSTAEIYAACGYMNRNEQNLAIGSIIGVEDLIKQVGVLYDAAISMHRFKA